MIPKKKFYVIRMQIEEFKVKISIIRNVVLLGGVRPGSWEAERDILRHKSMCQGFLEFVLQIMIGLETRTIGGRALYIFRAGGRYIMDANIHTELLDQS